MPTVLTIRGWRVVIYPNDHAPPHVHVIGPDAHARFQLLCDLGQVGFMDGFGLKAAQIRSLAQHLTQHISLLCDAWSRYHEH